MKRDRLTVPTQEEMDDPNSLVGPNWQKFADIRNAEHGVFDDNMPGHVDRVLLELLATKGFRTPGEAVAEIAGHIMARLAALESPALAAEFCRLLADQVEALEGPLPPLPEELHRLAASRPLGRA